MQIRKANLHDMDGIYEVEQSSFSVPWSKEAIRSDLEKDYAHYYVAEYDGQILGFVGLHQMYDEAEITNVAVKHQFRGKKIGHELVNEIIEHAKEQAIKYIFLEVRKSNELAKKLYIKTGFKEVGVRKGYYSEPKEDALLMACEI